MTPKCSESITSRYGNKQTKNVDGIYSLTLRSGTSAAGFGSLCGRFWHPLHPVHPDGHVTYHSLFVTCV
jgi:hypothetical protein